MSFEFPNVKYIYKSQCGTCALCGRFPFVAKVLIDIWAQLSWSNFNYLHMTWEQVILGIQTKPIHEQSL